MLTRAPSRRFNFTLLYKTLQSLRKHLLRKRVIEIQHPLLSPIKSTLSQNPLFSKYPGKNLTPLLIVAHNIRHFASVISKAPAVLEFRGSERDGFICQREEAPTPARRFINWTFVAGDRVLKQLRVESVCSLRADEAMSLSFANACF